MQQQKKISIYSSLANKYNLPYPVIEVICNSPFKFAKEVMSNNEDIKDIMFAYLFKLKLKKKYKETESIDQYIRSYNIRHYIQFYIN